MGGGLLTLVTMKPNFQQLLLPSTVLAGGVQHTDG
jgi:hypothetical protein